jgi:hypothetical protein
MIRKIQFLRWAKSKRLPVTTDGKLNQYGERVFAIWNRSHLAP